MRGVEEKEERVRSRVARYVNKRDGDNAAHQINEPPK